MDLTPALRSEIDLKTYDELLRRWRFSPVGDPMFQGESGEYWSRRMAELRRQGVDHVAASKRVGFA
jgi:hypothetical protein